MNSTVYEESLSLTCSIDAAWGYIAKCSRTSQSFLSKRK